MAHPYQPALRSDQEARRNQAQRERMELQDYPYHRTATPLNPPDKVFPLVRRH